jgi:hypothetical protein
LTEEIFSEVYMSFNERETKGGIIMDMLMLKLSTKFMKGIVAKIMSKKLYKKLGYKIDIQLNDVQIDMVNGDVKLHIDVDTKMNKTEFERLMEELGED